MVVKIVIRCAAVYITSSQTTIRTTLKIAIAESFPALMQVHNVCPLQVLYLIRHQQFLEYMHFDMDDYTANRPNLITPTTQKTIPSCLNELNILCGHVKRINEFESLRRIFAAGDASGNWAYSEPNCARACM